MLVAQNLCFTIHDKPILTNVNFSIEKGKLYGIIGHNGSGKSSLIKLLAGEDKPTAGEIRYEGESNNQAIHKMPSKQLAKHIAYLAQKLPDAQNFTVEELVMLGRYPWQKWLQKPSDEDHKIVATSMQQTQIDDKATQTVSTLSGGERARAWLAMCLAQQTDYLLLDEPLAALDIVYQVEVLRLIKELVTDKGLGVVIIIHDINLASQFCDEFIALKSGEKGGQICHMGDVASTMNVETLHDIFGISLHLIDHPVDGHKVAVV